MKLAIVNGPNLNLLGTRSPEIYGRFTLPEINDMLQKEFPSISWIHFQSNIEGELINYLQHLPDDINGVILNAAGYTHTSVALSDCISEIKIPIVEVHLSNILAREEFRKNSLISKYCKGVISGFGWKSYWLAATFFISETEKSI